jgi:hypothetical protein
VGGILKDFLGLPSSPMFGYPGWKSWAVIIGFLFLAWLAVKVFYRP